MNHINPSSLTSIAFAACGLVACGGQDPGLDPTSGKGFEPSPLFNIPYEMTAEELERFNELMRPDSGPLVMTAEPVDLGVVPGQGPVALPNLRDFVGTLSELREIRPMLDFATLEIERLELDPEALGDPEVRISAHRIVVSGSVVVSRDAACAGAPVPSLRLEAADQIEIRGAIDLNGLPASSPCGPRDGGRIELRGVDIALMGQLLASGAERGGEIDVEATREIALGPHRVLEVQGEQHGVLRVQSPLVRQAFDSDGPHLVMALDHVVEGRSSGASTGGILVECAALMGLEGRGESFYLHAPLPTRAAQIRAPEGMGLLAVIDGECVSARFEPNEGGSSSEVLEIRDLAGAQFGLFPEADVDRFSYEFEVTSVTR